MPPDTPRAAVVFGARNLGRAVIEMLVADGWDVTGVARSAGTLEGVRAAGARAVEGDVTDAADVRRVLAGAADAAGGLGLAVNAASPYGRAGGPFGGGPVAESGPEDFEAWTAAPARSAFTFLSAAGAVALERGDAATLVQVTGGSARRAMPGRGLWGAGSFAVRAITQAAAQELRPQGVHCALLIVDAVIAPVEGPPPAWAAPERLADPRRVAEAVRFLAAQGPAAATHELQVTPLAEPWVP